MRKTTILIVLLFATISVVNLHFVSKIVNDSDITLNGLIQTAFADFECSPPPFECPDGYVCDMGICKLLKSLQTQECSIVDWCWCKRLDPPYEPKWDLLQISCQGVKSVCSPDPFGQIICGYETQCIGCEPCQEGTIPYPYLECQETHP